MAPGPQGRGCVSRRLQANATPEHQPRREARTEGGEGGGQIIATGTPEEVAKVKASHTAKFLVEELK